MKLFCQWLGGDRIYLFVYHEDQCMAEDVLIGAISYLPIVWYKGICKCKTDDIRRQSTKPIASF